MSITLPDQLSSRLLPPLLRLLLPRPLLLRLEFLSLGMRYSSLTVTLSIPLND
jgi:hypothetical protein